MTEILRMVFNQIDVDEDRLLTKDEAQFAVQLIGFQSHIPDEVFLKLDPQQTGLNFEQFMHLTNIMGDIAPVPPIIRRNSAASSRNGSVSSEPNRKISDGDK